MGFKGFALDCNPKGYHGPPRGAIKQSRDTCFAQACIVSNLVRSRFLRTPQLWLIEVPPSGKKNFVESLKKDLSVYDVPMRKDDEGKTRATTLVDLVVYWWALIRKNVTRGVKQSLGRFSSRCGFQIPNMGTFMIKI